MTWKPFAVATLLAAAPLAAQHPAMPRHPMTGDPMGMQELMGPTMKVMLYMPQHLLARQEALGLTPDQVGRLTSLRDASQAAQDAAMSDAKAHLQALGQAADAPTPDTSALKIHFQAAHAAMGQAHWLSLAAAVQAKAALNDAQRTKVTVWADSMQAWMQQHRQMMKPSRSR
jgi:hypothetical protein